MKIKLTNQMSKMRICPPKLVRKYKNQVKELEEMKRERGKLENYHKCRLEEIDRELEEIQSMLNLNESSGGFLKCSRAKVCRAANAAGVRERDLVSRRRRMRTLAPLRKPATRTRKQGKLGHREPAEQDRAQAAEGAALAR